MARPLAFDPKPSPRRVPRLTRAQTLLRPMPSASASRLALLARPLAWVLALCVPATVATAQVEGPLPANSVFLGAIGEAGDVDFIGYDGLAGAKLSVLLKAGKQQPLLPTITLLDVDGTTELGSANTGKGKAALKGVLLPHTGTLLVRVSGGDTTGGYSLAIKEQLGKSAGKPAAAEELAADGTLTLTFGAQAGDVFRAVIKAGKGSAARPGTVTLTGPDGELALGDALSLNAKGTVAKLAKLPLPAFGEYLLAVTNAGDAGELRAQGKLARPKSPKGVLEERGDGGGGGDDDEVVSPPDPSTLATAPDPTVPTGFFAANAFLFAGATPIQSDVEPGALDPLRLAVLRGRVIDRAGAPLGAVKVLAKGRPELGYTATRDDGRFDLAVNGGGAVIVELRKPGYLPSQRQLEPGWSEFCPVPEVALVELDPVGTAVVSGGGFQVAVASTVRDGAGERTARLMLPTGTSAVMRMPDGSTQPLSGLTLRATEYTVGDTGEAAMPGGLPPTSAYTYCVEYSVDEALAAGAASVEFSQPLVHHVENFLGFPVGMSVPVGFFDREAGQWVAGENGRVIAIVGSTGALAQIDLDGDGLADDGAALAALGVTDAERQELAAAYDVGQELWRAPIPHFTPWDMNWPYGPPADAAVPDVPQPRVRRRTYSDACDKPGSVITPQMQVLGESLPLAGSTGRALHYASDRVPGVSGARVIDVTLAGATLHPDVARIDLTADLGGSVQTLSFPPSPELVTSVTWDGLDPYGRPVSSAHVRLTIDHVYDATQYYAPADFEQAFAQLPEGVITAVPALKQVKLTRSFELDVTSWDARGLGLGGWSLGDHHVYDPVTRTLYRGDGETVPEADSALVIDVAAGSGGFSSELLPQSGPAAEADLGSVYSVAVSPAGELHLADSDGFIYRVDAEGELHHVAGAGGAGWDGDDGPATAALVGPNIIRFGPDGALYFTQTQGGVGVRRIGPDGVITRVAGKGPDGAFNAHEGDGGPALEAEFYNPGALAIARDGTIYVGEAGGAGWIRRIGTDGLVSTVAGDNFANCAGQPMSGCGDGGPAVDAIIGWPRSLAVAPDGALWFVDGDPHGAVRRIGTDGIITTLAGGSLSSPNVFAEGLPATSIRFDYIQALALLPTGGFLVSELCDSTVYQVDELGIARHFVSGPTHPNAFACGVWTANDFEPALARWCRIGYPHDLAVAPYGSVFVADSNQRRAYVVGGGLPGSTLDEIVLADERGLELYVFDADGRHLRTHHALGGGVRATFAYDAEGRLTSVTDADGNVTSLVRAGDGTVSSIVAPGGQVTTLGVDGDGWLSGLGLPGGHAWSLEYTDAPGLLTGITDPDGNSHAFSYDADGLLVLDEDGAGGSQALVSTDLELGRAVSLTTARGRTTTYTVESLASGAERRTTTAPDGAAMVVVAEDDGVTVATAPDGTVVTSRRVADPRFATQSLLTEAITRQLPSGLTLNATMTRTEVLADAHDVFSLTSLIDTTTVNGHSFTEVFDATTGVSTRTTPTGRSSSMTLDEAGRLLAQQLDPALEPMTYVVDSRGRILSAGSPSLTSHYAWNGADHLLSVTRVGSVTSFAYDTSDRLASVTSPGGRTHAFGWDGVGNLVSMTTPAGNLHLLAVDGAGRRVGWTAPLMGSWTFGYDLDGDWTGSVLPSGRAVLASTDAFGRLDSVSTVEALTSFAWLGGGGGCCGNGGAQAASLQRAPLPGQPGQAQTIAYTWDGELRTNATWSGASNGSITTTWSSDWMPSAVTTDGVVVALARDADGLLTELGPLSLVRDGPLGMPTSASGDGGAWSWGFDTLGRTTSHAASAASTALIDWTRGFDALGRVTSLSETVAGVTRLTTYGLDADGQLVSVSVDGVPQAAYTWDADGNRTSGPGGAATYDGADRVLTANGLAYVVDDDGQLVQRGADSFRYGTRGELLAATVGGQDVTYSYDALGRLVARTDVGGTWSFLYDELVSPVLVSAARSPAGVLDVYLRDESGRLLAFLRDGDTYLVGSDPIGSPRVVADASGVVIEVVDWDAFGVRTADSNAGFWLPIGWAGGIEDPLTGLVRFGARDYEPATGRFTTLDPTLFESNEYNLYRYGRNAPHANVDPTGTLCVSFDAYAIYGGGVKLCADGSGFSACVEVGLGAGGGLEIDPFGSIVRTPNYFDAAIKLSAGPLSLGPKLRLTECEFSFKAFECRFVIFNLCEGKFKARPSGWLKYPSTDWAEQFQSVRDALFGRRDPNTGKAGFGVRLQGKVAGARCDHWHW